MGWRDRATKEASGPSEKSGGWRDRAVKEDDLDAPIVTPAPYPDEDTPEVKAMKAAEQKYDENRPGTFDTFALGAYQGATRDWGDEIAAKVSSVVSGNSYEDSKARIQQKMNRAKAENPGAYGTGEFTGALSAAPVVATPWGAAAMGAAEGVTRSLGKAPKLDADSMVHAGLDGTIDGVGAGAMSKFGPMAFKALSKATKPITKPIADFAGRQAVKALQPTQGMLKRLNEKGLTEDVGQFALDNDIVRPFNSAKNMNETAQKVTQKYADRTKPIYEQAKNAAASSDEMIGMVQDQINKLSQDPGKAPIVKKLMNYAKSIENAAASGKTSYNPLDVKKFRQDVQDTINFNSTASSQLGAKQMRAMLRDKEMKLIEKVDPSLRKQNEGLFKNIRLGNEVERIAERGEARSGSNNLFGLNSGIMGSAAGSGTLAVTGDPTTAAIVAATVGVGRELTKRYGNQWAATGANGIKRVISGEKFAPLFEAAARKGGTAIADLHQQLMQSDPDYSQAVQAEVKPKPNGSRVMHARDLP